MTTLLATRGELSELRLEMRHTLFCASTPDLELRFTRTSSTNAAGQTRERVVLHSKTRHVVFQLRELDLQLAVVALRSLREDVQDQLRAIDDLQIARLRNRRGLRRRQIAIEDQHIRIELHRAHDDVFELAFAENELGID